MSMVDVISMGVANGLVQSMNPMNAVVVDMVKQQTVDLKIRNGERIDAIIKKLRDEVAEDIENVDARDSVQKQLARWEKLAAS